MRVEIKAGILMVLAMFFYGASFPATKYALSVFGPISIITFRLVLSSCFLLVWNLIFNRRIDLPKRQDIPLFLLIALLQPFGYFICETIGLEYVSATIVSVIIATIPVFTPILSRWFLEERLYPQNYIGLVLSFLGVILLIFSDGETKTAARAWGILLVFGAVSCAVFYTICVKRLPSGYSSLSVTSIQNSIGLLFFLPVYFLFEHDQDFLRDVAAGSYGYGAVLSIIFLSVFASTLAFIFMNHGIRVIGPSKANGYVNLIPAITAVISFLFLGETFSGVKILGITVILAGVLLSQHGRRPASSR